MAASFVTEFQSVTGDCPEIGSAAVDEPVIDQMFDHDHDFTSLGVDFDFCSELQLDGVDFPTDIWNTEMIPSEQVKTDGNQNSCEKFDIDEDFNQMLDDWDNQLDSIHTSQIDDLLPKIVKNDDFLGEETDVSLPANQTVTLKKPLSVNSYRGQITSGQARQVPASTSLRAPVVTRGVCYTRSGGIGVSRSVHTSGVVVNSSPRVSLSNQFSVSNRQSSDEPSFLFTPVSPIRSPVASSNAPDFFIASTRSTADVVKSSYSRLLNQCRNSIITTNPESEHRNSPVKIIAAVSPKSDGTSTTKILSSHNSIRESLPKELIDKIRAASQGRKTIAIIEPINRKDSTSSVSLDHHASPPYRTKQTKFSSAAATLGKWKNVGIAPSYLNNVSDHDYCSPGRATRFSRKYLNAQSKVMRQIEESMNRNKLVVSRVNSPVEEGETKKDSGLESCEMSDASEDGSSVYDKLPRYLTNASVQTVETRAVQDDHGYNRLPAYLIKPQQSLLKSNLSKSVVDKHNIVVSPVESVENSDAKPDISLAEPASAMKMESTVDNTDSNMAGEMLNSRVVSTEKSDSRSKRRRDSFDSSSDETDSSFRKSYKRRRSNHPRPSSRDSKRRRFRGRSRSCSSSTERSSSRQGWRSRPCSKDEERSRRHVDRRDRIRERKQQQLEHKVQVEERKIIYVGKIEEGTLKSDLRSRFEAFGPIVDISVHFREHGDNYGFLTFKHQADAYRAIERGNDDSSLPKYDLCFGGRRTFCREDYCDLDDVEFDGAGGGVPGFDELLRMARKEIRK